MKVLVLNGSPRPKGNTSKMTAAFKEAAEASGHDVCEYRVAGMNINGCLACEYYHGISGQLKCAIDRFYSALYPDAPENLKYIAMFLASGDKDQYTGARFSFDGDFLGYLGLEDKGFFTCVGEVKTEVLDEIRAMAKGL